MQSLRCLKEEVLAGVGVVSSGGRVARHRLHLLHPLSLELQQTSGTKSHGTDLSRLPFDESSTITREVGSAR